MAKNGNLKEDKQNMSEELIRALAFLQNYLSGLNGSYSAGSTISNIRAVISDLQNAAARMGSIEEQDHSLDGKFAQLAGLMNTAIDELPIYGTDMENMSASSSELPESVEINPVITELRHGLESFKSIMSENEAVSTALSGFEEKYRSRLAEEYSGLSEVAFSSDIISDKNARICWSRMACLAANSPELDRQFQLDRLSMMFKNQEFCRIEIENAKETLSGISLLGTGFAPKAGSRRYRSAALEKLAFNKELAAEQLMDDAEMTLLVGQRAQKEFFVNISGKLSNEQKLLFSPSGVISNALKHPEDPAGREKLNNYVKRFISCTQEIPDTRYKLLRGLPREFRYDKSVNELTGLSSEKYNKLAQPENKSIEEAKPLLSDQIRGRASDVLNEFGNFNLVDKKSKAYKQSTVTELYTMDNFFAGIKSSDLLPLMKSGTKEANALRDEILNIQKKFADLHPLKADDFKPLYNRCVEYLSLKSGTPKTESGKRRAEAAAKILRHVGLQMAFDLPKEEAEKVVEDVQSYMIRNKKFRDDMVKDAAEYIKRAGTELANVPDNDQHLYNALKIAAFGKLCDKGLNNGDINIKLDDKQKAGKIRFMTKQLNKTIGELSKMDDKALNKFLSPDDQNKLGEMLYTAESNAAFSYTGVVGEHKFMLPGHTDEKDKYPDDIPNTRLDFRAKRGGLQILSMSYLLNKGYNIKDILNPEMLQAERKEAGDFAYNNYKNLSDDKLAVYIADSCISGMKKTLEQISKHIKSMPKLTAEEIMKPENRFIMPALTFLQDYGQEMDRSAIKSVVISKIGAKNMDKMTDIQVGFNTVFSTLINGRRAEIDTLSGLSLEEFEITKDNAQPEKLMNLAQGSFAKMITAKYTESILKGINHKSGNFLDKIIKGSKAIKSLSDVSAYYNSERIVAADIANSLEGNNTLEKINKLTRSIISGEVFDKEPNFSFSFKKMKEITKAPEKSQTLENNNSLQ